MWWEGSEDYFSIGYSTKYSGGKKIHDLRQQHFLSLHQSENMGFIYALTYTADVVLSFAQQ